MGDVDEEGDAKGHQQSSAADARTMGRTGHANYWGPDIWNLWPSECRAPHAITLERWRPREMWTGPSAAEGKTFVARNLLKCGKRTRLGPQLLEIREALEVLHLYDRP